MRFELRGIGTAQPEFSLTQVFGRVQFIDNDALQNLNGLSSLQLGRQASAQRSIRE